MISNIIDRDLTSWKIKIKQITGSFHERTAENNSRFGRFNHVLKFEQAGSFYAHTAALLRNFHIPSLLVVTP
jgi:hypothetical protein